MSERPTETRQVHTRLLKCALEIDDSRAYWQRWRPQPPISSQEVFDDYWFGAKSLARVKVLLTNCRARFDVIPKAIAALHAWPQMHPETRRLICHWHLQLSDPMYRGFTGALLPSSLQRGRLHITRVKVIDWVKDQGPGRWTTPTQIQLASKLMSSAYSAGLLGSNRDPRPLLTPRVPDEALAYLMYLLRGVDYEGTPLENPYLISVGLYGGELERRLARLPGFQLSRQGDLLNFHWAATGLLEWVEATQTPER